METYDETLDLTKEILPALQIVCNHILLEPIVPAKFIRIHNGGLSSITKILEYCHVKSKQHCLPFIN